MLLGTHRGGLAVDEGECTFVDLDGIGYFQLGKVWVSMKDNGQTVRE